MENQSASKKERRDIQPSGDLLSDLPLSVIHFILALVPIRDAVRTSLLSRQWRYTWATLPHLAFDYKCVSSSEEDASDEPFPKRKLDPSDETRLNHFITQALFHHKGPIHKCEMSVYFGSICPDIDDWIHCLVKNDIKDLALNMGVWDEDEMMQVPCSIYSCEKLTRLVLRNCVVDPPPLTFKGFLFLRCLVLKAVSLSHKAIESLVASSPFLEAFELRDYSGNEELRISAPNLKYLYLAANYNGLCMYAPLLADMSVTLMSNNVTTYHQQRESLVCNYASLMGGFTNLKKLSGSGFFTKYLCMGIEFCHRTLEFHHLKDIDLDYVDSKDRKVILVVARLIIGAPNLHELRISILTNLNRLDNEVDDAFEASCVSFGDFGCAPNFKLEKLRHVTVHYVKGILHEMELIKFLLERSPALETMLFSISHWLPVDEEPKVAAKVRGFSRASPNAKLLCLGRYQMI